MDSQRQSKTIFHTFFHPNFAKLSSSGDITPFKVFHFWFGIDERIWN
jgi:hypothetical protein